MGNNESIETTTASRSDSNFPLFRKMDALKHTENIGMENSSNDEYPTKTKCICSLIRSFVCQKVKSNVNSFDRK